MDVIHISCRIWKGKQLPGHSSECQQTAAQAGCEAGLGGSTERLSARARCSHSGGRQQGGRTMEQMLEQSQDLRRRKHKGIATTAATATESAAASTVT
ncbi:hypothetical protein UPYG_G00174970 [Umbra pygmaea]|uniref:Uncharacterized protein n=1 Tax=Umbra pygmaea TaxID=75934 RepID=A0ABD0WR17_UMBPY